MPSLRPAARPHPSGPPRRPARLRRHQRVVAVAGHLHQRQLEEVRRRPREEKGGGFKRRKVGGKFKFREEGRKRGARRAQVGRRGGGRRPRGQIAVDSRLNFPPKRGIPGLTTAMPDCTSVTHEKTLLLM